MQKNHSTHRLQSKRVQGVSQWEPEGFIKLDQRFSCHQITEDYPSIQEGLFYLCLNKYNNF